jgi:putative glycosyltransferase (TIGR04348 family)
VKTEWDGDPCDLLLALHARRSHPSVLAYRKKFPAGPLVVALTGTDLYRDLPESRQARDSLKMADRIIVLQSEAIRKLNKSLGAKVRVVYQSSNASIRRLPSKNAFRVAVVGHLREVKDPFRAALALAHIDADLDVLQIGDALTPGMKSKALAIARREPRYRWLGGRSHAQALGWIARSHLLVVSSVMEGGANVISEAARIGTPLLVSRVSGNLGMLGRDYPGYFPLRDERALGRLMSKAIQEKDFYRRLRRALAARRRLFAPAAEKAALGRVVKEALQ